MIKESFLTNMMTSSDIISIFEISTVSFVLDQSEIILYKYAWKIQKKRQGSMMHYYCAARGGHNSQSIINQSDNQWREKEEYHR
jgi:hypothetical protein